MTEVERLLSDALRPIEPPEQLSGRFEDTLAAVTQAAAEELSDWADELSESELRALRDPRNWVRPVVAVGLLGLAAAAGTPRAKRGSKVGSGTTKEPRKLKPRAKPAGKRA